jgi:hypothetical protein
MNPQEANTVSGGYSEILAWLYPYIVCGVSGQSQIFFIHFDIETRIF